MEMPCTICDATSAAECLLKAQEAYQPYYRKLNLSMAASWLSLARQNEAIDNLLADLDMAKPIKTDELAQQSDCQVA
jgi:hypothetical protein